MPKHAAGSDAACWVYGEESCNCHQSMMERYLGTDGCTRRSPRRARSILLYAGFSFSRYFFACMEDSYVSIYRSGCCNCYTVL